jgi:uncharacterized zinc-type alcohol dehydrogenase-like protein
MVSKNADEMKKHAGSFDFILDTSPPSTTSMPISGLLKLDGTLVLVGAPPTAAGRRLQPLFPRRNPRRLAHRRHRRDAGDARFLRQHGIVSDIEMIPIQKINEAYERMLKSDVKYRFVIDMARAPLHAGMLERHFGCSPRFKARRNALVLRAADMDRAFVTHNQDVLA